MLRAPKVKGGIEVARWDTLFTYLQSILSAMRKSIGGRPTKQGVVSTAQLTRPAELVSLGKSIGTGQNLPALALSVLPTLSKRLVFLGTTAFMVGGAMIGLIKYSKDLMDRFKELSPSMAAIAARRDIAEMFRSIRIGEAIAPQQSVLVDELIRLGDSMEGLRIVMMRGTTKIASVMARGTSIIVENFSKGYADILETAEPLLNMINLSAKDGVEMLRGQQHMEGLKDKGIPRHVLLALADKDWKNRVIYMKKQKRMQEQKQWEAGERQHFGE